MQYCMLGTINLYVHLAGELVDRRAVVQNAPRRACSVAEGLICLDLLSLRTRRLRYLLSIESARRVFALDIS